ATRPATGDFQMALLPGRPLYSNARGKPTLTERTLPRVIAIRPPSGEPVESSTNAPSLTSGRNGRRRRRTGCDPWFSRRSHRLASISYMGDSTSHANGLFPGCFSVSTPLLRQDFFRCGLLEARPTPPAHLRQRQ